MGKWLVGIDLGGTTIKGAFISQTGEILNKWEIPTDISNGGKNIVFDIANSIDQQLLLCNQNKTIVKGIGIGAPAFLNMDNGFVYQAINIGWKNYDLKSQLELASELPVIVDNDANIAAIGEMWKGAGAGYSDLICITLGTGVGGGIIINGEVVHGVNGMAGEIGHITVMPEDGLLCNCGKNGCLETISSATGMVRLAMNGLLSHPESALYKQYKQHGIITSKLIVESAKLNDKFANEILNKVCYYLGLAIANIANTINPSIIIIGGGVSKAGILLLQLLTKYFKKFALPRVYESITLALATLGNNAGVIGGAWLVKNKL